MAKRTIVSVRDLDESFVLAPERYDPRRQNHFIARSTCVSDLAIIINETTDSKRANSDRKYLVLDTSDARDGIIWPHRGLVTKEQVGSAKKIIRAGDVIISRLRPYLRQVAYVDSELWSGLESVIVVCSTEFYVLRSQENLSLAFLIPFLLSSPVQDTLAVAQEGGHHPRFNKKTLESLPVPKSMISRRKEISAIIEDAVLGARKAFLSINESITGSTGLVSELYSRRTPAL